MEEYECNLGVYPLSTRNKEKLLGCELVEQTECKQLEGKLLVFQDKYRKLKIILLIRPDGSLYVSDYYGDTISVDDITFIFLGSRRKG